VRKPDTPVYIYDLDQAAVLCSKFPGVFRARRVRLANGLAIKSVISVSFWPWVLRRQRLIQVMASEVARRFVLAKPPPIVLMRARRVRKLQRAYDDFQDGKDRFYDAERE